MSRPRFLADHDLNELIAAGVLRREPALEFIRLRDVGLSDRPDAEVLAFAAANGFLLVSHDVNTMPAAAYARVTARAAALRMPCGLPTPLPWRKL
jgi:predicted nuclease of predicted toxin-antitoxin system